MVAIRYSRCPVKFLIWILLTLLSTFVSSVAASLGDALTNITFSPPYLDQLKENTNRTVWIRVSFQRHRLDGKHAFAIENNSSNVTNPVRPFASSPPQSPPSVVINFKVDNAAIARIVDPPAMIPEKHVAFDRALVSNGTSNSSTNEDGDDDDEEHWVLNTSFTVRGIFLGKTKIQIQVFENDGASKKGELTSAEAKQNDDNSEYYEYDVWVVRHDKKLTHIFVGTLMILLIVANVLMGAQLNLNVVFEVIKRPFAPAVGFICQFLIMPLISFGLAHIFFVPVGLYNLGLGLFTTGCCPGGGASNAYTVLLDGNVDLSITMTFLSTLLSLATMPLWMFALGRQFLVAHPGQRISIPYNNIMYSLLMLVLPLCAGIMVRRFMPKAADIAKKVLRPFLGIIIVFICTFGVYVNLYMFKLMNWRVLVGGLSLPWLGFAAGLLIAVLARQPKPNVVAISIETGIQNTGIAIMLLQLSFAQPDADLAAVLPVVVAMFTPAPMVIALIIHYVSKWRIEKKKKEEKAAAVAVANGVNCKTIDNGTAAMVIISDEDERGTINGQEATATTDGSEEHHHLQNGVVEGQISGFHETGGKEIYGNGFVYRKKSGQGEDEKRKMLEVSVA